MTTPAHRLYPPKRIALLGCAGAAGIALTLFRRFHQNGELGSIDVFSAVVTLIVFSLITFVIVRRGNRPD